MNLILKNWLFISLYYNQSKWSILIYKGLIPFIEMMKKKGKIDMYVIHFSSYRGSSIGLSLRKKNNIELENIAAEADHFFKDYFRCVPSPDYLDEFSSFDIFTDFPNNTIQYALHHFPFSINLRLRNKSGIRMHYKFSQIMLRALRDEVIDNDMLCTFYCYLHLILISNLNNSIAAAADLLESLIKIHISTENDARNDFSKVVEKYRPLHFDNKILINIIKDVLLKRDIRFSLETKWVKAVNKLFSSNIGKEITLKLKSDNNECALMYL